MDKRFIKYCIFLLIMATVKYSSSEPSAAGLFLGAASIGAAAYHGYCDAQEIPFEKENLEFALTYGPAIVQGGLAAAIGGVVGLIGGGAFGATSGWRDSALEKIAKGTGGAVLGTALGAGLGGAIGGIKGGVQTLIGYGVGYLAGYALK